MKPRFMTGPLARFITVCRPMTDSFLCSPTGMLDGAVHIWKGGSRPRVLRVLPAQHDGAVLSMCVAAGLVVSGGADGMVKVWSVGRKDEDAGGQEEALKEKVPLGMIGYGGGVSGEGEVEETDSGNRAPDKVVDVGKMLEEEGHSPFLHAKGGWAAIHCIHVRRKAAHQDRDDAPCNAGWNLAVATRARELVEVSLPDLSPATVMFPSPEQSLQPPLICGSHPLISPAAVGGRPYMPRPALPRLPVQSADMFYFRQPCPVR